MSKLNRREFIRRGAGTVGALAAGVCSASETEGKKKRSATDLVTLGRSGLKVTRLAMGTGSMGGRVQREMGQEAFTKMVRHAYDRGVRFFDTADNYKEMHEMLAIALKGIDRDTYCLQTKIWIREETDVSKTLDRFRKELNSDYFDTFLLHCMTTADWPTTMKPHIEGLEKAKDKQIIRSRGASCHGLKPLRAMPGLDWLDVALVRVNHDGTHMDGPEGKWSEPGNRSAAVEQIQKIHQSGTGVIGMKLIGNGDFTDPQRRDDSIKFVTGLDCVDVYDIGFKNAAEIDEAIERINTHLNSRV